MAIPGYVARASLYATSRSYRGACRGPRADTSPTVVTQQGPCDIGGGGGGGGPPPPPPDCPRSRPRCCERDQSGRCILCVPTNAQCP